MDGAPASLELLMYNVRKAVPEDFSGILPMAQSFYEFAFPGMDFDLPSILEHYILMLTRGFVYVAEEEGELVGMLGCLVTPFPLNNNYLVCSESMWWVNPSGRGLSIGSDMVEAAEAEAEELGCHRIILSSLATSPGVVEQYYESKGYALAEKAFIRSI